MEFLRSIRVEKRLAACFILAVFVGFLYITIEPVKQSHSHSGSPTVRISPLPTLPTTETADAVATVTAGANNDNTATASTPLEPSPELPSSTSTFSSSSSSSSTGVFVPSSTAIEAAQVPLKPTCADLRRYDCNTTDCAGLCSRCLPGFAANAAAPTEPLSEWSNCSFVCQRVRKGVCVDCRNAPSKMACARLHRSPCAGDNVCGACFKHYEPIPGSDSLRGNSACTPTIQRLTEMIEASQNPENCSEAKFLVGGDYGAGFGSNMWYWRACLAQALDLGRVLVQPTAKQAEVYGHVPRTLDSYLVPWSKCGWDQIPSNIFQQQPIQFNTQVPEPTPNNAHLRVLRCEWTDCCVGPTAADWYRYGPEKLRTKDNMVNSLGREQWPTAAEQWHVAAWQYMLRPNELAKQRMTELKKRLGWNEALPTVGMQIRHTDKGIEAALEPLRKYMEPLIAAVPRIPPLAEHDGIIQIYLATDDPSMFREAHEIYNNTRFRFMFREPTKRGDGEKADLDAYLDVLLLGSTDVMSMTYSSNFGQLGLSFNVVREGLCFPLVAVHDMFHTMGYAMWLVPEGTELDRARPFIDTGTPININVQNGQPLPESDLLSYVATARNRGDNGVGGDKPRTRVFYGFNCSDPVMVDDSDFVE